MTKTEQRLREIADKGTQNGSDIAFVRAQAAKAGVEIRNFNCADCYRDAAILVLLKTKQIPKSRKYALRDGVDVVWKGIRINNTCSDEQLAQYLADGFPRDFYCRIDGVNGKWL